MNLIIFQIACIQHNLIFKYIKFWVLYLNFNEIYLYVYSKSLVLGLA